MILGVPILKHFRVNMFLGQLYGIGIKEVDFHLKGSKTNATGIFSFHYSQVISWQTSLDQTRLPTFAFW